MQLVHSVAFSPEHFLHDESHALQPSLVAKKPTGLQTHRFEFGSFIAPGAHLVQFSTPVQVAQVTSHLLQGSLGSDPS